MAVATLPRQRGSARAALHALDAMVSAWQFVATPAGRDPRLDLLRGFCVFAMIVDHIGGASWLYAITGGNVGPVTAAEGFVFLSGLVLGIVSRKRLQKVGLRSAIVSTLKRSCTLYLLTSALTAIFVALTVATSLSLWVDRALLGDVAAEHGGWLGLAASILMLRFTWHGTDILALYALLLVAAPLALVLLARGQAGPLLAGSWALWLACQFAPERLVIPWEIAHAHTFPFAAWQAFFATALTLGYHKREIASWLGQMAAGPRETASVYRAGLAAGVAVLAVAALVLSARDAFAVGGEGLRLASYDPFDKPSLGIGRLLAFAGLGTIVYGLVTFCWRPIERAVGWLLVPLGQASLYAYTVHLFLILVAYNVPPYVGMTDPGWELHNTIGQLALVLVTWAMVKRRFLFGLIPR